MREIYRGANIVDGTGGPVYTADIAVEGARIVELGHDLDGDRLVDCSGRWIMPGAIDAHVHVMVRSFDLDEIISAPFSLSFYLAAQNLNETLRSGVTFVRDTGGADLGVKRAQELGYISGPGIQISVNLLSITGGHADHWAPCGFALPDLVSHPGRPDGVCDGPDEVIRRTREMIRAGADFIKVCATGGVLSPRDHPSDEQFLPEELALIVRTAAAAGKPVAAHAQGSGGIKNAIRAGVRSIEHGTMLDDEAIELMLRHGTFLVPTLTALHGILARPEGRRDHELAQARELFAMQRESVSRAIAAGVKIALGSDAGVVRHGRNLDELPLMVDLGMTPLQALTSATATAADLLQLTDRGRIAAGCVADLLVLESDPTRSVAGLAGGRAIIAVIQSGRVVSGELAPSLLTSLREQGSTETRSTQPSVVG